MLVQTSFLLMEQFVRYRTHYMQIFYSNISPVISLSFPSENTPCQYNPISGSIGSVELNPRSWPCCSPLTRPRPELCAGSALQTPTCFSSLQPERRGAQSLSHCSVLSAGVEALLRALVSSYRATTISCLWFCQPAVGTHLSRGLGSMTSWGLFQLLQFCDSFRAKEMDVSKPA